MLVYESKLQGTKNQYKRLDEAIRTGRFVRNSVIRAWIDGEIMHSQRCLRLLQVAVGQSRFSLGEQIKLDGSTGSCRKGLGID